MISTLPTCVKHEAEMRQVYKPQPVIAIDLYNSCKEFKLGYGVRHHTCSSQTEQLWMEGHTVLWHCITLSTLRITKQPSASELYSHFFTSSTFPLSPFLLVYFLIFLFISIIPAFLFFLIPYHLSSPLFLCPFFRLVSPCLSSFHLR